MSSRVEIILDNTPFPGAGQQIGGYEVIESMLDIDGKNWAVYLKGNLNQAQVKAALKDLTSKHHALPVQDEFSLVSFKSKGMLHARTNPPGDVTVVRGHMYYARPNPISSSDFHKEMDDMLIDNPEKHFTRYTVRNTEQLHDRLWKGVSYAGESYGWKKGDDLWHRRASFIMPKIKINKALEGATMFYHTHPAKDEPSLTSADDIQFYLDLHFAWGINSFYTIMKHKLDHFTITSKPGGKEKYLRMEEGAFIDTVDGMIEEGEKVAKKEVGNDRPEVEFQNRITKEMVDLFNKKFNSIAKISFRPKAKNPASKLARKPSNNPIAALVNPTPNPPIKVDDRFVAKALDELKGLDYAHEHYGADEYGHTMYVYWWLKHHLAPTPQFPKGRLWKLNEYGMDSDTRQKLRAYLSQSVLGNYNYMDIVYLLALYHDIAKLREKGVKETGWEIGAEMFRNEIGPELELPSKLTEDIAFLLDTDVGRKGISDKDFLTQAGDYYGASKLLHMADMITHHPTMYKGGDALKQELMVNFIDQLRDFLDHHYVIPNPPPQVATLKWVADYGIGDLYYEEVDELLGEFHQSVIPDNDGKTKPAEDRSSGGHLYRLRFNSSVVPGLTRYYAANLALSSSKLVIDVGSPVPDDLGKADANLIYQAVGERLRESYPEVVIEEVEPESLVNPRHANKIQVISISGPSGGGKSTVLRYLNKHIPNSSTPPTFTTRPKRPTDGDDRRFVSKTTFKKMIEQGQFVEYTVSGAGHYYGRRFKDFYGNVAIIEVSLDGKKHYESRFANVFSVYLDPDPSITEEERAKAIYKRGGVTKEEAKRRAKKATETVERSKKMQFDLRVTMKKGKYEDGAKKVLSEVPLVNPVTTFMLLEEPYREAQQDLAGNMVPLSQLQINRNRQIQRFNIQQQAAYNAGTHVPWMAGHRNEFTGNALLPPGWFHDLVKGGKYGLVPVENLNTIAPIDAWDNPSKKELFDWFEDWVKLVNMKNKELKTFLDSDWGKVAGLSPQEAKKLGIRSGRVSGRHILKMRKKIGLTGPKDYIDPNKPRILEDYYEKALNNWNAGDWEWCKHQVNFNNRFKGDPFSTGEGTTSGKPKGHLVIKQKTQNKPSPRLLGLWVWGHDPWRYARKVEKRGRMPPCPNVPWVGMTEKRKWGVIEVIPRPKNKPKKNPAWPEDWQVNPYVTLIEPWTGMEVMIDEEIAPLIQAMWKAGIQTMNSNQITNGTGYIAIKGDFNKIKAIIPDMELHQPAMQEELESAVRFTWPEKAKDDFRNKGYVAILNAKKGSFPDDPIMKDMWDTDYIINFSKKGQNALHAAFGIPLPNPLKKKECPLPPKKGIIIYGASWCKWCNEARKYLDKKKKEYTYVDINKVKNYQKNIFPLTDNYEYIPVIFVNGKFIGGYSELVARKNPKVRVKKDEYRSRFIDEEGNDLTSIPVSSAEFKEGINSIDFGEPITRDEARKPRRGKWLRVSVSAYKGKEPIIEVAPVKFFDFGDGPDITFFETNGRMYFKNMKVEGPIYPTILSQIEEEPHAVLLVQGRLRIKAGNRWVTADQVVDLKPEIRDDITDWVGESKGRRFQVFEEGEIVSLDFISQQFSSRPYKGGFMAELHELNRTKRESKQVYNVHMTDEGDHYFLHEVQVAEEFRGRRMLLRAIQRTIFNMPEFLPDYPDKKPIRALVRVVEGIPQEKLVSAFLNSGFKVLEQDVDGGVLMEFKWYEEERENPPPRSKPFPWNKARVAQSPFKTMKRAQAAYDSWKKGMPIGFSATSSLKSMGKIPRASGKYELGEKYERKNPRTKKGRAFPKKYLKGLNATEKAIAMYEIDKGYEYDVDDPKAYEFWVSDIKSKARGLKTVPSKWRNKFAKKYGPMKDGRDFLGKVSNTTGVERKYLKKIYDKGLAAWRVGHRPGVQQHQWAAGRVYAFVMGAPSSTGPGKPDHKLAVKAGVR